MNLYEQNRMMMKKYGIFAQKKYGQNFLINENVLDKIIENADITTEDLVIEIGPGLGNLTKKLCEKSGKVIAVEIDSNMVEILKQEYGHLENLEIINEDIMKLDLTEIIKSNSKKVKIVANLPYYITTPIIMKLLEDRLDIDIIEVMVQKEVAERLCTEPGNKSYGAITVAVDYYTEPTYLFDVTAENFLPSPEVDSAVIKMKITNKEIPNEKMLFKIVKAAFSQRRKTLLNSLGNAEINEIGKTDLTEILKSLNIDEKVRAEELSLDDFINLANKYSKDK